MWGRRPTYSILPEFLEAVGGEIGVAHGVLDIAMAQGVLDGAGVLAVVGELVAAGVPEHVRMDGEGERGEFAGALKHLTKAHRGYGAATLS
jgi:hypothetical protein